MSVNDSITACVFVKFDPPYDQRHHTSNYEMKTHSCSRVVALRTKHGNNSELMRQIQCSLCRYHSAVTNMLASWTDEQLSREHFAQTQITFVSNVGYDRKFHYLVTKTLVSHSSVYRFTAAKNMGRILNAVTNVRFTSWWIWAGCCWWLCAGE